MVRGCFGYGPGVKELLNATDKIPKIFLEQIASIIPTLRAKRNPGFGDGGRSGPVRETTLTRTNLLLDSEPTSARRIERHFWVQSVLESGVCPSPLFSVRSSRSVSISIT